MVRFLTLSKAGVTKFDVWDWDFFYRGWVEAESLDDAILFAKCNMVAMVAPIVAPVSDLPFVDYYSEIWK